MDDHRIAPRFDAAVDVSRRRVAGVPVGVLGYFLALSLLAFGPVLGPGFVLSLDMTFSPTTDYLRFGLSMKGPLYYGRLPLLAVFDAVALVVPDWVVQRAALVGIVTGSGLAGYAATRRASVPARLFAGTLYAVNPFVYVRLLAGHWYFLLGYAVLPMAVVSFHRYLAGDARLRGAVGWATLVSVFDPHAAVLLGVAWATLAGATYHHDRPDAGAFGRRLAAFGAAYAGLNAFWLLPALAAVFGGGTTLAEFSALDLAAFSASGTVAGNVPLSVAALYGFWRGGYVLPADVLGRWVVLGLFVVVLYLAVSGLVERRDDALVVGVAAAAGVGFGLAMGVSTPYTAPPFRFLYDHVFVLKGMRDTQKFAGLLALGYAVLGAAGVDAVLAELGARRPLTSLSRPRHGTLDRRTLASLALVAVLLAVPLVATITMVGGFWGQFETTDYPDGWHAADDRLADDPDEFRALVLPWHQYMAFDWTRGTVANPADLFFEVPVVRGRNVEVAGVRSHATDPTHVRVTDLLTRETPPDRFGAATAPLGVKYVVLLKEVDYRQYEFLREQADLAVALENDDLVVFENEAFDAAPPPDEWPRASPPVPWTALVAGSVVAGGTAVLLSAPGIRVRARTALARTGVPARRRKE